MEYTVISNVTSNYVDLSYELTVLNLLQKLKELLRQENNELREIIIEDNKYLLLGFSHAKTERK